VLVSNGVYAKGERVVYGAMTNRTAVTKPVKVQSLNGPAATKIQGYQVPGTTNGDSAIRCVYLTNRAELTGFTLFNGATRMVGDGEHELTGGGVWCESPSAIVSNCWLVGNSAVAGGGANRGTLNNCAFERNSATYGGGAYAGNLNRCTLGSNLSSFKGGGAYEVTLNNCILIGNSVSYCGGGAYESVLNNCTLTGNSSTNCSGGAYGGALNNCIAYFNIAVTAPNWLDNSLSYCSTTPLPAGAGNFTNPPLFVNQAGGNLRLQSNSPCINSGLNVDAHGGPDLDGNPRIVSGTVDIGAYEFQGTAGGSFATWLGSYGLPTDGSADFADSDGDGLNNWQEWRADTVPTNSLSVFRLTTVARAASGLEVTWRSVVTRSYFLQRATNLRGLPPFTMLVTNIAGQLGTTTYTDTNVAGTGPFFYRAGVQP
jgi:hypothetical protein